MEVNIMRNKNGKLMHCCCCGRQLSNDNSDTNELCPGPFTPMGPTLGYCCSVCSCDLDEYGMFPEERNNCILN